MKPKKIKNPSASRLSKLKALANRARQKAYAPYSKLKVGAALLTQDQNIFTGCNVENASYGGTICAERTAILKAISEGGKTPFQAIHVSSSADQPWPPCGLCLQMMAEFCAPSTLVSISGRSGDGKLYRFSELLPESFDPRYLKK